MLCCRRVLVGPHINDVSERERERVGERGDRERRVRQRGRERVRGNKIREGEGQRKWRERERGGGTDREGVG